MKNEFQIGFIIGNGLTLKGFDSIDNFFSKEEIMKSGENVLQNAQKIERVKIPVTVYFKLEDAVKEAKKMQWKFEKSAWEHNIKNNVNHPPFAAHYPIFGVKFPKPTKDSKEEKSSIAIDPEHIKLLPPILDHTDITIRPNPNVKEEVKPFNIFPSLTTFINKIKTNFLKKTTPPQENLVQIIKEKEKTSNPNKLESSDIKFIDSSMLEEQHISQQEKKKDKKNKKPKLSGSSSKEISEHLFDDSKFLVLSFSNADPSNLQAANNEKSTEKEDRKSPTSNNEEKKRKYK